MEDEGFTRGKRQKIESQESQESHLFVGCRGLFSEAPLKPPRLDRIVKDLAGPDGHALLTGRRRQRVKVSEE